ncbi:MAG: hypothetical protein ACFFD4_02530 [Candidatus Odinarchaeota archaeon]
MKFGSMTKLRAMNYILATFMMLLVGFSVLQMPEAANKAAEENSEIKNETLLPGDEPGNDVINPVTTSQATSSSDWTAGESITTSITGDSCFIIPETIRSFLDDPLHDYYTEETFFSYSFSDNSYYWEPTFFNDYEDDNAVQGSMNFAIDTQGQEGTLYYDMGVTCYWDDCTAYDSSSFYDSTIGITTAYIDYNGRVNFDLLMSFKELGPYFSYSLSLAVRKVDGTATSIIQFYDTPSLGSGTNVTKVTAQIDEFRFVPSTLNIHERSEYRSLTGSAVQEHKLFIENYAYGTTITLSVPLSWNFTKITPLASTSWSDNDFVITDTVPVTYELRFLSGAEIMGSDGKTRQVAQLAMTESDVLANPGFETGKWSDDWEWGTGYAFSSTAVNSTIAAFGSLSCRLEDSDGSDDKLETVFGLQAGYYLASVWVYIESFSGTGFSFQYHHDGSWTSESINTSITDRWHPYTWEFHIDGGLNYVQFVFEAGQGVIFLDDFKIWKANGQVRTTGYHDGLLETGIFATIRKLDHYNNLPVSYLPVNVSLVDRTADATIITVSTATDVNGRIELYFVLPSAYQLDEMEYTLRIETSTNTTDSYFTPLCATNHDYAMENETFGFDGFDFSAETDDGASYYQCTDYQISGYNRINPDSATRSEMNLKFVNLNDITASDFTHLKVLLRTNVSDLTVYPADQEGNQIGSTVNLNLSSGEYDWSWIEWDLSTDPDWISTENGFYFVFDENGGDGLIEANNFVWVDYVRLVHKDIPVVQSSETYAFLYTDSTKMVYFIEIDGVPQEYIFDFDPFMLDQSEGSHTARIYPFLDLSRKQYCFIIDEYLEITYDIAETGIMKLIYHDQSGKINNFDGFKTYIDGVRLYDQYYFSFNTSATFNLTITDIFDNLLYQNTTESFEDFKEIQITLYSVKILNVQPNPVYLYITRGGKTYSEWVLPGEIVKYYLESAEYNFSIVYSSDVSGSFGSASTNGTVIEFIYAVDTDTALLITGESLQDVFNNIVSLSGDLDAVNASLSNQIIDVEITVGNVNTSITNQIVNVVINLDNVNSSIGSQLIDIQSQISNLETNITLQINSLGLNITNMNSTIFTQTIQILSDIQNVNTTIYEQTALLLSNLSNVNSTLYSQTVTILSDIANVNSTLFYQGIETLTSIVNSNATLYNATQQIYSTILTLNSTLYNQTMLFDVYFAIQDGLGLGLPFETVKLYVNGTRQYSEWLREIENGTVLEVKATDGFGYVLFNQEYIITSITEINVTVPLYYVIFRNDGNYTAYLEVYRGSELGLNITVSPGSEIMVRMTSGEYSFKSYYFKTEMQNASKIDPIYDYGKTLAKYSRFSVTAQMPSVVDVSTPVFQSPDLSIADQIIGAIGAALTISAIVSGIVTAIVMRITFESWYVGKAVTLNKAPDDSLVMPDKLERKYEEKNAEYNRRFYQQQVKRGEKAVNGLKNRRRSDDYDRSRGWR